MRIYMQLKNNTGTAKFHSDPTWNAGALCFFEERRSNKKKNKNKKDE